MLRYATKLTREPWAIAKADVDRLWDAGFSDRDVLHIVRDKHANAVLIAR